MLGIFLDGCWDGVDDNKCYGGRMNLIDRVKEWINKFECLDKEDVETLLEVIKVQGEVLERLISLGEKRALVLYMDSKGATERYLLDDFEKAKQAQAKVKELLGEKE